MKTRERERLAEEQRNGGVELVELRDAAAHRFHGMLALAGSRELGAWRARVNAHVYRAYRSLDPYGQLVAGGPDWRWHLSVSHWDGRTNEVPAWPDLVAIAHAIRPGVPFVVGIPPRSWWMNVHGGVLHVVETRDRNLIQQWQHEAQGHRPT